MLLNFDNPSGSSHLNMPMQLAKYKSIILLRLNLKFYLVTSDAMIIFAL